MQNDTIFCDVMKADDKEAGTVAHEDCNTEDSSISLYDDVMFTTIYNSQLRYTRIQKVFSDLWLLRP